MSNVKAVMDAQKAKTAVERQFRVFRENADIKRIEEMAESARKLREAKEKYEQLSKEQMDHSTASFFTHLFILMCCITRGYDFFEDLWIFVATPIAWAENALTTCMEWLYSPYYYGTYEEIQHYSPGMSWFVRIITVLLILTAGIIASLLIITFALYCIKKVCALSLRVAYCTFIMLTVTPLSQLIPWNLVMVFCMVQLLFLVVIQILDIRLEYDRRYEEWIYLKTL